MLDKIVEENVPHPDFFYRGGVLRVGLHEIRNRDSFQVKNLGSGSWMATTGDAVWSNIADLCASFNHVPKNSWCRDTSAHRRGLTEDFCRRTPEFSEIFDRASNGEFFLQKGGYNQIKIVPWHGVH